MRHRVFVLALGLLALVGCQASPPQGPIAPPAAPLTVGLEVTTVAEGLNYPWGLALLQGGDMLVTERNSGTVRLVRAGQLVEAPVLTVPEVFVAGQGGLLDIVLHPQFSENGYVYLSYATGTNAANATRLARARWTGERLEGLEVLFTASPLKLGPAHFGGRLLFLPDGTLLLGLGDGFRDRMSAQDLSDHRGKILRLTDTGSPAPGNPFPEAPAVFSYGHRNVQGLARDPVTGALFAHEHGPKGGDEVNALAQGRNYGWPVITYGVDYSGAEITPFRAREGMEQPLDTWTPSIAPSGMIVYRGGAFPQFEGDLLVTGLVSGSLWHLDLQDGRVVGRRELLADRGHRLRQVIEGPAGELYILTDSDAGAILKITPRG